MPASWTSGVWRSGMFPLHALLIRLRVIMVYPCLITCNYALHKQISLQLHEIQVFTWCFASTILHFRVKHSEHPTCTDFCHQLMFAPDRLNGTSAYVHIVGYQQGVLAISCTLTRRLASSYQYFQQHDRFLRRELRTDVPTGAHLQGFFCLHKSQLPCAWPWHMMAHPHRI